MKKESNSLVYKTKKTKNGKDYYISIRLNDECKNGHQDFSITGDVYQSGKPKIDKYWEGGGAMGDTIAELFPEFSIFNRLHLCDYLGIPMHASANMHYHMREGFNRTKPNNAAFKTEFCDYYRITPEQFDTLKQAQNEIQFALIMEKIGIFEAWKLEADAAIKQLEELTGEAFVVDSVRTQYHAPTAEQRAEEAKRQAEGYYTPEAAQMREQAKKQKEIDELEAERTKEIEKVNREIDTKLEVLRVGGTPALDNCIFYTHTNQLAFNWRGYDQMDEETVDAIIEKLQLPEGVTVENKKAKV